MALTLATGVVFVGLLLALVLTMRGERRRALAATVTRQRPDTIPMLVEIQRLQSRVRQLDADLGRARFVIARRQLAYATVDTFPYAIRARRDTLLAARIELSQLLVRADRAPLPSSYRALGNASALRGDPRVRQLLDSLATVERSRAGFGAAGGVDPVFMTLTARAAEIGRQIRAFAAARHAGLRVELERLAPVRRQVEERPSVDTTPLRSARNEAAVALGEQQQTLVRARTLLRAMDDRAARAREEAAAAGAPPLAMLSAALVVGLAIGFTVALVIEVRSPRIASGEEAARVSGAPVLLHVRRHGAPAERARRQADREIPPLIDQVSDSFRLLYTRLAGSAFTLGGITVAGDDSRIVATVSANLAASAAYQAQTTLLVDADLDKGGAAALLRARAIPGVTDMAAGRVRWPEAIVPAPVGRGVTIDLLPAGCAAPGDTEGAVTRALEQELPGIRRRYDTVIVSAPGSRLDVMATAAAATGAVIFCAKLSRTPASVLRRMRNLAEAGGAVVRGVVLWEAGEPDVPPSATIGPPAVEMLARRRTPVEV